MEYVLTKASSISCDHPVPPSTGGGAVTPDAGQTVLTVGGDAVLAKSLQGAVIKPGCSQINTVAGQVPCSLVQDQSDNLSKVLKVNGSPVLLDKSSGNTNGKPDSKWSTKNADQAVLRAD